MDQDGPFASDTLTNTYQARLRTALALQQPAGIWTNGFTYDAARRLTRVSSPAGTFTNEYSGGVGVSSGFSSGLVKRLLLPNLSAITNEFDSSGRLLATHLRTSTGALTNKHEYVYNRANQRTNEVRIDGSAVAYRYDPIGQLKVADSSVAAEDRGYTYDAAWNLNYRTNNGAPGTFGVNIKNELTNAPSGQLTFDANGNALTGIGSGGDIGATAVAYYDDENRLTVLEWPDFWLTELTYDGLGRLRKRLEYESYFDGAEWLYTVNLEIYYVYDGNLVVQERTIFSTPTVSYTRGSDLSGSREGAGGIGGLLARSHGYSGGNWSTHNYYHSDGNGNVTFMLNTSQSMVARYRYDPFGKIINQSGAMAGVNAYRFSSKEYHNLSGMYYYLYRWYSPDLQRWVNRDPIGEKGGINLYTFVENNPVNEYDIYGHVLGRRNRSSCNFWDVRKGSANKCTSTYATAAAIVCRIAGESPWEQCQRWCLQATYTTFGETCNDACSTARFVAMTAARYSACAAACLADTAGGPVPPLPPTPPIPRL